MSFDPNQPDDWSGLDSSGPPKRRDPVLDLFATNESRELEPIEDDEDDVVPAADNPVENATEGAAATSAGGNERNIQRDSRKPERPAGRDRKTQPPRETAPARSGRPTPKPVPPPVDEPAAKPPATSHWAKLAGMLGIGGKAGRDAKDAAAEPAETRSPPPAKKPAPPSAPRATERPARPELKKSEPAPAADIAWKSPVNDPLPVDAEPTDSEDAVEEIDPGHVRFLDGEDYVEFEIEELDPEGKLSLSKGAALPDQGSDDEPAGSPRRGSSQARKDDRSRSRDGDRSQPRRRRQRPASKPAEAGFAEGLTTEPPAARRSGRDDDWNDDDQPETGRRSSSAAPDAASDISRPPADPESGESDRPRKRRRRRGRGRGKGVEGSDAGKDAGGSESDIAPARTDEIDADSEEHESDSPKVRSAEPREPRERGGRGRGRGRDRNRDRDVADGDDSGDNDERARKTVITWSDAISGMIDRNMKSRKGRSPGGRGNSSNKPRGNSGPRRR